MRGTRLTVVVGLLVLLVAGGATAAGAAIESEALRASEDAKIPFIITLKEQPNLAHIRGQGPAERRRNLLYRLKATAVTAQADLRRDLADMVRQGRVERVRYFWVFNGIAVRATPDAAADLASRSDVESVTLDRAISAPRETSGGPPEPNLSTVNAPALWSMGLRGQGITVANMDTGVDVTHPDLSAQWRGGSNSWYDPSGQHPTTPTDVNGHGTWTMGVMVGRDAGGTAVGMAPDANWIGVKIFNDSGVATTSGIHAGFQWLLDPDGNLVTDDGADVVNNSWASGSPGCDLTFQPDLQALRAARVLPIFAAGNYGPLGSTSASPANNPEAFAVGATDDSDGLWSSSSRGPSGCGEPQATYPELVAPGVSVHTTDLFGTYVDASGTSMAAPHVAGAAALLLSGFSSLTADQQQAALLAGAVDLGPAGPDNDYGHGRLDALESYQTLASQPDFSVTAAPTSAATDPGGTVSYTATVTPTGGFTSDVVFSLAGLSPAQASWSFTPPAISGGSGSSQLAVTTAASLAPGSYPLTITATSGSVVHTASITLVVNPLPDFGLVVTPSSRTVKRGSSTTYTVDVTGQGGFTGTVGLSVAGLPPNTTATFSRASVVVPGSSTLTVTTTRQTARGTFTLNVRGQSGSVDHQVVVTLIVK